MGRIVFTGTKGGPALRPHGPWPTSTLVQLAGQTLIVDCGLGVTRGITDAGVDLRNIDRVLITHLHSDHVLELAPLLHTAWTAGLQTPVEVIGPPGIAHVVTAGFAALQVDIDIRIDDEGRPDIRELVQVRELDVGSAPVPIGLGDMQGAVLRVPHPPLADCFAFRIEGEGAALVLSGDTAFHPPLAEFARGADMLVHEALYLPGVDALVARTGNAERLKAHLLASHTSAQDAGRIAAMADAGHLVLNHLVPADDPNVTSRDWEGAVRETYDGPLTIARDGLAMRLGAPRP